MIEDGPKRFDQILKKAEKETDAFFSGVVITTVALVVAVGTFPGKEPGDLLGWAWKAVLGLGLLGFFLSHLWREVRFALVRRYKEAGAFMTEALKGPVSRELPFRHLWSMREVAWAEHQDHKRALAPAAAGGFRPILLLDASGEEIFIHTRIACAGCGRSLNPWLARDLWKERADSKPATRIREDLDPSGRCIACGHATGRFRAALDGPVEGPD